MFSFDCPAVLGASPSRVLETKGPKHEEATLVVPGIQLVQSSRSSARRSENVSSLAREGPGLESEGVDHAGSKIHGGLLQNPWQHRGYNRQSKTTPALMNTLPCSWGSIGGSLGAP